jgi:hypothetical protein
VADVTVIIPIGPGHEDIAKRAASSCHAQSLPVEVIEIHDPDRRGPGWARNRGLEQVTTEWVIFLDADDWIEPRAVEMMARAAALYPGHYIYSDWYELDKPKDAPDTGRAWCNRTWHAVTALVPTAWARRVGGFDESLSGGEDTDFYMKLDRAMLCGARLPEPLLHYTPDGARGHAFVHGPDYDDIMNLFSERYGGQMGCCGKPASSNPEPSGERRDGDVLAIASWGGNRRVIGVTGRDYGRTGNYKRLWVDPRDCNIGRNLFIPVEEATPPKVNGRPDGEPMPAVAHSAKQVAAMLTGTPLTGSVKVRPFHPGSEVKRPVNPGDVIRLAQEALHAG